jgi:hypothetical protein
VALSLVETLNKFAVQRQYGDLIPENIGLLFAESIANNKFGSRITQNVKEKLLQNLKFFNGDAHTTISQRI